MNNVKIEYYNDDNPYKRCLKKVHTSVCGPIEPPMESLESESVGLIKQISYDKKIYRYMLQRRLKKKIRSLKEKRLNHN